MGGNIYDSVHEDTSCAFMHGVMEREINHHATSFLLSTPFVTFLSVEKR